TADNSIIPSVCRIRALLDEKKSLNTIGLKIAYEVRTLKPRTIVMLGCQKAKVTAAKTEDGKTPVLQSLPNGAGLAVEFADAGDHRLDLELEAPISVGESASQRCVDLDLPGCAITIFEAFDLPESVAKVRLNGKSITAKRLRGNDPAAVVL